MPTKERKDSVKIADGTCSAVVMMMTLTQFGMMCFRMIRPELAPTAFAARMYSLFLMVRISPRTSRAMLTQYRRPKTMKIEIMLDPRDWTSLFLLFVSVSLSTTERRMMISMSGSE